MKGNKLKGEITIETAIVLAGALVTFISTQ